MKMLVDNEWATDRSTNDQVADILANRLTDSS